MLLQYKRDGPAQTGLRSVVRGGDLDAPAGKDARGDFLFDYGAQAAPGAGQFAYENEARGRQAVCKQASATRQVGCLPFKRADRARITLCGERQQIGVSGSAPAIAVLQVIADRRVVGSKDLPATTIAAGTKGTGGVEHGMSEFAAHATRTAHELPVGEDAGADAFRNSDNHQICGGTSGKPGLRQCARVRGILQSHFEARGARQRRAYLARPPLEVGRKNEAAPGGIHTPREAHPDALKTEIVVR